MKNDRSDIAPPPAHPQPSDERAARPSRQRMSQRELVEASLLRCPPRPPATRRARDLRG